jgi:hypothetical protein
VGRVGWGKAIEGPLSQWRQVEAFDSASECELAVGRLLKQAEETMKKAAMDRSVRNEGVVGYMEFVEGRCVASDDPGLKRLTTPG